MRGCDTTIVVCHTPPGGTGASRTCPGCGASLDHRDPQVRTCSARCRQRAHRAREYDPEADYRTRAAAWDPEAELARIRALGLQPAAALVPPGDPTDPADRLRGRTWRADPDPGDRPCPRPRP